MNSLRSILVGIIVGGAFGAKVGAYLSIVSQASTFSWLSIELGFLAGSVFGLVVSFVILFVRSGILEEKGTEMRGSHLSTNAA